MFKGSPTEEDLLKIAERQERDFQHYEMVCSECDHYRELTDCKFGKCLMKRGPFSWVSESNKMCLFKPKIKKEEIG